MTTRDETATGKPAPRRKLGRGLGALLGEARREEPLVRLNPYLPSDDFGEREQTAHYEDGRYRGRPQGRRARAWPIFRWARSSRIPASRGAGSTRTRLASSRSRSRRAG